MICVELDKNINYSIFISEYSFPINFNCPHKFIYLWFSYFISADPAMIHCNFNFWGISYFNFCNLWPSFKKESFDKNAILTKLIHIGILNIEESPVFIWLTYEKDSWEKLLHWLSKDALEFWLLKSLLFLSL